MTIIVMMMIWICMEVRVQMVIEGTEARVQMARDGTEPQVQMVVGKFRERAKTQSLSYKEPSMV
jgi:hypothetical protein